MADHQSASVTTKLETLWDQSQGNPARFLFAAYQEAVVRTSVIDVREGLSWLNSIKLRSELPTLRVSVITNFVIQGMQDPLELFLVLLGLNPIIEYHPPYQFEADVSGAQAVLLLIDYEKFVGPDGVADHSALREWVARLKAGAAKAKILMNDPFQPPSQSLLTPEHEWERGRTLEREVDAIAEDLGVTLVRWNGPLQSSGLALNHRASHYIHYDQILTSAGLGLAANVFARYVAALFTPRKKVVCMDADNTLWFGMVGEDGADGVLFLPDSAPGRCYYRVLRQLQSLSAAGLLLAIVSKNNENTVLDVLARPDFPLKREDFSAVRINWRAKSQNLKEIAAELNLALDSFVYVDDSEFEIAEVLSALPEVAAVQVPKRIEDYGGLFGSIPGLDRLHVTKEDRERKNEYHLQAKRRRVREENPVDFARKLSITVQVHPAKPMELARVAQLFLKTNQFRFALSRPTEEEIKSLIDKEGWIVLAIFYSDIFGDSGLVGGALLQNERGNWHVRNLVISCRVIGRGVEEALLADWSKRYAPLRVDFETSGRNQVAEACLNRAGWVPNTILMPRPAPESIKLIYT